MQNRTKTDFLCKFTKQSVVPLMYPSSSLMVNSESSSMNTSQNFACSSYMNTTHFAIFEKECKSFINPLHPKISLYILHTALYTFPKVLTERICLPIKSFFCWWSFPLFSWPLCVIQGWYCREKLDASHS